MWLAVGCILVGIPLGWLCRTLPRVVRATNTLASAVIYLLLFFLGVGVGSNDALIARLGDLGVQGVLIGVCCALGSAVVTALVQRTLLPVEDKA